MVLEKSLNFICIILDFPDDLDKLEEWSDDEDIGTEGNTEGVSVSMTERQKKESRGILSYTVKPV